MLEINLLYSITGTPHTHGLTTPSTRKYPKMPSHNHCFDKLDQKKIKNAAYLSYLQIFISTESMCHAPSTSNIKNIIQKNQKKKNQKKNQKNQ